MNSQTKSGVNLDDFKINADLTSPNTKSRNQEIVDNDGNGRWLDFCFMQTMMIYSFYFRKGVCGKIIGFL